MKKELLKKLAVAGIVGAGISVCGLLVANHAEKKAKKEIEEINEKIADDKIDNVEARLNRLERENMIQNHRNIYFGVCATLYIMYMWNVIDKNFIRVQEKHNGLVNHVGDTFIKVGEVCENFEERISAMEVK